MQGISIPSSFEYNGIHTRRLFQGGQDTVATVRRHYHLILREVQLQQGTNLQDRYPFLAEYENLYLVITAANHQEYFKNIIKIQENISILPTHEQNQVLHGMDLATIERL